MAHWRFFKGCLVEPVHSHNGVLDTNAQYVIKWYHHYSFTLHGVSGKFWCQDFKPVLAKMSIS